MDVVNLCPHPVVILREGQPPMVLPASDRPARVQLEEAPVGELHGVPLLSQSLTGAELPEAREDRVLVVSHIVRSAHPERTDLLSPARLVRDEAGAVIACEALAVNQLAEVTRP
jgi:hypothetical protein